MSHKFNIAQLQKLPLALIIANAEAVNFQEKENNKIRKEQNKRKKNSIRTNS